MSTREPPIQNPPPTRPLEPVEPNTAHPSARPLQRAGTRSTTTSIISTGRRFNHYLSTSGWVHLLLLAGAALFLFPFLWMLSTSIKTDEELINPTAPPRIPTFLPQSPYVREQPEPQRPAYVEPDQWERLESTLREQALRAVASAPSLIAMDEASRMNDENETAVHPSSFILHPSIHHQAAANLLMDRIIARIPRQLWEQDETELLRVYARLLTPGEAAAALDDRLARFELRHLQLRTLDARIFNIAEGTDIADQWRVESGPGQIITAGPTTAVLRYRFDSPRSSPVVLRTDFPFPAHPDDLHKLILSIRGDDSWHRIDAILDLAGVRWESQRATWIAQHRPSSIIFQPPTFDDQTFRARTWIPLRAMNDGIQMTHDEPMTESPMSEIDIRSLEFDSSFVIRHSSLAEPTPAKAVLRIIISPSGTPTAIYGKAQRNYSRAFLAVPFWLYVFNSLLLVGLTTAGALFSSAFVAYAFARLNWPGRSVAFVILLSTMMLPAQVTMIPSFMIWRELGWYNTLNPMWVPAWFGVAFFIFLMTQHMKTIPKDLEEAARIDGLNAVQTWWYIFLPLVKPSLAAIAIMTFMGAWNEFMGPLIYLRDQARFPLSLGLFGINLDYGGDWTMIMAGNMLMTLPVIIIFFIFQRYFIQGMTMTGMKG